MMKLIPLAHNSKIPLKGEDWHNRISDDPEEHARWLAGGYNVGCPMKENGLVVVDFDRNIEAARSHFKATLCQVIVKTKRGVHFYYSGTTATRKFPDGDIKGNGYCVFPPSQVNGHEYVFLRKGELQPFPEELFPIERKEVIGTEIKAIRSYIERIESIQGKNGSAGLVRAAAKCRDAGLSAAEATVLLLEWNQTSVVNPPWPSREIARAVTRVFDKPKSS